jgi:hypothetical protein
MPTQFLAENPTKAQNDFPRQTQMREILTRRA